MTKAKISEYDAVASNNTDVNGVNIAENCPPSGMNNMGREIMAALKRFQTGSDGDGVTVGGNLVVSGSSTLATTAISSADINGGTIDGTAIGGASAAAGAFTTLSATGVTTVQAGTNSAPAITTTGDTNTGIFFPAADTIAFAEGGAEAMRIDSSGNVGIGTNNPSTLKVTIERNGGQLRVRNTTTRYRSDYGVNSAGTTEINSFDDTDSVYMPLFFDGNPLQFFISASEKMRIDSSGNLLVGTTTNFPGEGNTVAGLMYEINGTLFQSRPTGGPAATFNINENSLCMRFNRSGTTVGSVSVTTTATAFNTSSDYRLKNTIAPMTGALAKVALLKPCTYKWNADNSHGEGFIAHEIQEVAPYAVSGEKDGEQMQGVDYGKITPLLTAALQEAIAEIQSLKARVAELEAK
jgi:hypothetical protein